MKISTKVKLLTSSWG